jgi:hypothetical protein
MNKDLKLIYEKSTGHVYFGVGKELIPYAEGSIEREEEPIGKDLWFDGIPQPRKLAPPMLWLNLRIPLINGLNVEHINVDKVERKKK